MPRTFLHLAFLLAYGQLNTDAFAAKPFAVLDIGATNTRYSRLDSPMDLEILQNATVSTFTSQKMGASHLQGLLLDHRLCHEVEGVSFGLPCRIVNGETCEHMQDQPPLLEALQTICPAQIKLRNDALNWLLGIDAFFEMVDIERQQSTLAVILGTAVGLAYKVGEEFFPIEAMDLSWSFAHLQKLAGGPLENPLSAMYLILSKHFTEERQQKAVYGKWVEAYLKDLLQAFASKGLHFKEVVLGGGNSNRLEAFAPDLEIEVTVVNSHFLKPYKVEQNKIPLLGALVSIGEDGG